MSTTLQTLTAGGILRPAEVVELAAAADLPLPRAAVVLVKESSGGRNVWGRDGVQTGGAYTKGGAVTRANYLAYRALVQAKKIGRQGVGPTQLTYYTLQDRADALGGCWEWRINVRVGFEHLAQLQRQYGVRDGFRRYNGNGAPAEEYAAKSMELLVDWERRLAAAEPRELRYGMRGDADVRHLQEFLAEKFPLYAGALPATGNYLEQTVAAVAEFQKRAGVRNGDGSVPDGRNVAARTHAALAAHGFRPAT